MDGGSGKEVKWMVDGRQEQGSGSALPAAS